MRYFVEMQPKLGTRVPADGTCVVAKGLDLTLVLPSTKLNDEDSDGGALLLQAFIERLQKDRDFLDEMIRWYVRQRGKETPSDG